MSDRRATATASAINGAASTAYGRYFEWDANGLPTANNNKLLTTIPRML